MRTSAIILLIFMSLLMSNCASSGTSTKNHHKQKYAKTFKTGMVRANFGLPLGAMGSTMSLEYNVQAYCFNASCSSSTAVLSFYLQSGSNSVSESNRSLSIHAGDKDYHWNYSKFNNIYHGAPSQGRLVAVILKKSDLKKIAKSKKVTGKIAGERFRWSYKNRKPLRLLVNELKKAAKGQ
jgi:hypothetical protein